MKSVKIIGLLFAALLVISAFNSQTGKSKTNPQDTTSVGYWKKRAEENNAHAHHFQMQVNALTKKNVELKSLLEKCKKGER